MINLKRLKLMRTAARVVRYHTMPTLYLQSVGEHTFGCLTVMMEICEPTVVMMSAMLYHDAAEPCTGDTPSNVKWTHPGIEEELKLVEAVIEEKFALWDKATLTEWERHIVKYCDLMEGALFALEEFTMGNRLVAIVARDYLAAIEKRGLEVVTDRAMELYTQVKLYAASLDIEAYARLQYLHGRVEL